MRRRGRARGDSGRPLCFSRPMRSLSGVRPRALVQGPRKMFVPPMDASFPALLGLFLPPFMTLFLPFPLSAPLSVPLQSSA